MSNHLKGQLSPYLLQHSENPVNWYPWGKEAFEKAVREDKPVFLSIGYSTCHWCHVMAHESFEDKETAELLNKYFVSIKVDKEERPDIDSIYMAVCQKFTGSGGWPTSIFMTGDQKPFFAGTYFPKTSQYGVSGFDDLLCVIHEKWQEDRDVLFRSAEGIISSLELHNANPIPPDRRILDRAIALYEEGFDEKFGGFGCAPKFPAPHNLLFLMQQYRKSGSKTLLEMSEKTLIQMYRGGLFDHIGGGFCRYSTDPYYLVPHFEKMLYDNALLIIAYSRAYEITGKQLYKEIAGRTCDFIMSEMASPDGGFYSAQDADSEGKEGKYYVFTPNEIKKVLGQKQGAEFCLHYGITDSGNFEGKSIPNLLHTKIPSESFDEFLPQILEYRKKRIKLHTDDKILTFWNSLMIAALCYFYRICGDESYLVAAKKGQEFLEKNLCKDRSLFVSWRKGRRGGPGYLDDYAGYIFSLLSLYECTFDDEYIFRAEEMTKSVEQQYFDKKNGGFFLCGKKNETLIMRPKESYDGAVPSGNSLMSYNLVRLGFLAPYKVDKNILEKQLYFMTGEAKKYPSGFAMFLVALSDYLDPPPTVTVVKGRNRLSRLPFCSFDSVIRVLKKPRDGFDLIDGDTAFYVCKNHTCYPPMNEREFYKNPEV